MIFARGGQRFGRTPRHGAFCGNRSKRTTPRQRWGRPCRWHERMETPTTALRSRKRGKEGQ